MIKRKTYWKDLIQSFTGSKGRFFIHLDPDDVGISSLSRPQSNQSQHGGDS